MSSYGLGMYACPGCDNYTDVACWDICILFVCNYIKVNIIASCMYKVAKLHGVTLWLSTFWPVTFKSLISSKSIRYLHAVEMAYRLYIASY